MKTCLLISTLAITVVLTAGSETAFGQRPRFDDPFRSNTLGLNPGPRTGQAGNLIGGFQQPAIQPPSMQRPAVFGNQQAPVFQGPSIINAPPPGAQIFGAPPVISQPPANIRVPQINPGLDPFNPNSLPLPRLSNPLPRVNVPQMIQVQPPQIRPQNLPSLGVPNFNGPNIGQPQFQQPQFQQPQYGQGPGYGTYQLRNQWPYQTPGTNWWPSMQWPSQAWARLRDNVLPRVLERPRFRHTWIHGNNGNELDVNDVELATTATIPNWLNSGQPIRISPNFIFHFWNGPDAATGFDLPSVAYSAFLSADYISDPRRQGGIETNLGVGVYTDFDNINSDSLRITGSAVGWRRLNSYTTAKLGVEYLNRIKVKLLPAFGVFMAPNRDLKIDLYFPRPKIAHRIPGYQGLDAWAYVGGEYGGGSWTITRDGGMEDQVDINDVRAFMGLEWLGPRRVTGFFEVGYVFERELLYRTDPLDNLDLQDSIMIRSGLAF